MDGFRRLLTLISICGLLATTSISFLACQPKGESYTNRLAGASSPYLKEHGDNPVDWYEWSPEALEKAKTENKPLLISIGYSSCHWCHVMEEESFMDTAVARIMNQHFVSIKIDREERPDLDQIYVGAAQLIMGNAGWPLNAFALPDGQPFYMATYAPKEQWKTLLLQVAAAYKEDAGAIAKQARLVTDGIKSNLGVTSPVASSESMDQKSYVEIFDAWQPYLDMDAGGLRGAPKFPMPVIWEAVLQHYYLTGNKKALVATVITLDAMAKGGIFDQIGGGFARYSTDDEWKVPHFEKMLYDNAQLVSLYAHCFQVTRDPTYERVIRKTLTFVATEMTSPGGGFYSSLNADSEGEEGKFYVWTKKEIETVLDEKTASLFMQYYNVAEGGNWADGKNILHRTTSDKQFATGHGLTVGQLAAAITSADQKMLDARNKRVRPSTDDKVLTGWNALMLNGYVDAYFALGDKSYLDIAIRNAEFLASKMVRDNGRLERSYAQRKPAIDAFLDDYAFLASAYVHLYEATFDAKWLEKAKIITDYAIKHFRDDATGLFFYSSDISENLVARTVETTDNVVPSSNSTFASTLFRLGEYLGQEYYNEIAATLVSQVPPKKISESPSYANWAKVRGFVAFKPFELAVTGPEAISISSEIYSRYLPTTVLMGGGSENLPLLEGKLVAGQTIIYVCRDKVCKLPTKDVEVALQQLGDRTQADAIQ